VLEPWKEWSGEFISSDAFVETLYNDLTGKPGKFIKHNWRLQRVSRQWSRAWKQRWWRAQPAGSTSHSTLHYSPLGIRLW